MSPAARRAAVADLLPGLEVDALVVSDMVNCRYLSGFAASNAAVAVGTDVEYVTDARYSTAFSAAHPDFPLTVDRDATVGALLAAARWGARSVGVESHVLTLSEHDRLRVVAEGLGLRLVPVPMVVEPLRARKDPGEIGLLRQACSISEAALARLLPEIVPGRSERWLAARLEFLMVEEGAEAAAFPSIVASGPYSAEPHHEPTDREVGSGDLLVIDFGARVSGYHADMTRTFVLGAPAGWQVEQHAVVAEAAAAGRAALREGMGAREVDAAARAVVEAAGHGSHFGHGLGHGVGLRIHEAPMMGPMADGTLASTMTVTVEPGVYLPGRGGVRIEDCLEVTAHGAAPLTTMTRELLVL